MKSLTDEDIILSKAIHHFVREELEWEESINLLSLILESNYWLSYLDTEILIYEAAKSMNNR